MLKLNDAISPTEINYYWDMFYIDMIRLIAHQLNAQSITIQDIKK